MSRSYKKVCRTSIAAVSHKALHKWKKKCKKLRRTRCKQVLNKVDLENSEDDESFYPEKYQHDMNDTTDWSGPHDGYFKYFSTKDIKENEPINGDKFWKYLGK